MEFTDLKKGELIECDEGLPPSHSPSWMDIDKFKRGQRLFQKNIFAFIFIFYFQLVAGLSVPKLLDVLVFSNQTNTPKNSLNRYLRTFYYLMLWHFGKIWNAPNDTGFKSIVAVKKAHNKMSHRLDNSKKSVISQYDMALVQYGFMGTVIMYPKEFGIRCSKQDLEDYIYFWRGIGYLLGIKDEYNICCGNFEKTFNICKEIEQTVILPNMENPPKDCAFMLDAFITGTNLFTGITLFTKDAIFARIYNNMGLTTPCISRFSDRIRYWCLKVVFAMLWRLPYMMTFLSYVIRKFVFRQHDSNGNCIG